MGVASSVPSGEFAADTCGILTQLKQWLNMPSETRDPIRRAAERLNAVTSYITLSSVIYYAVAILILHLLRTDFDPGYRYLSEYAVGPYGALMTSMFFVLSAGSVALAIGLWRSVSSKLRFLPGLLFWLTWACAVFLAGWFTGDLQGTPHTRIDQIHEQMMNKAAVQSDSRTTGLCRSNALSDGSSRSPWRTDQSHRAMVLFNHYFDAFADVFQHRREVVCNLAFPHVNRPHTCDHSGSSSPRLQRLKRRAVQFCGIVGGTIRF